MMRARVAFAGALHEATPHGSSAEPQVRLADGRVLGEGEVVWLPPFAPGTVIALGLNYADHAKELAFNSPGRAAGFPQGAGDSAGSPRRNAPSRRCEIHAL
jgi:5-oxopent-3-ene-1,2,5-tricarboxylate decarboxylase/2-hydroxyhepta-2,4-diene-1,7-dioate isomerase